MKDKIIRALVSVAVGVVVYFIGESIAYTDEGVVVAYLAGVIAAGCCWIGSKE